ncbi:coproporphyrinogen III oxidase family protein [Fusobacterium perfoetens]|uniref:coproporphyrinogen-III oxidase family protein n=1 Tax=Fusobacterium perfoetens TaxID=852 RepID=UPI001F47516F|nr:coproporphyrinogen-III oxidase family protein [Fusobacterium perfoetens]MCF2625919.1 coproporphyrinogen III oxidase family protein [Fusobacterium perfoetens]
MFKIRYKSHHDVKNVIEKMMKRKIVTPFTFNKVLKGKPESEEGGIYVHTPYCDKICSFCNMNRKQIDNDLDDYTEFLCKEFKKYGEKKYIKEKKITTIFFGGGTPTIYKAHQLEKILLSLKENFNISEDCEFTFETTLHNLTWEKLEIMEKYGVNRISIGIQTFSDRGRKLLNRTYDKEYIVSKIKDIRKKFKGLICIDIIYNYPDQTDEEIINDAETACELGVDSISFYSLMIQEGSQISKDREENKVVFKYNLVRDKELHDKFLEIALSRGYSVLEHTKITNGKDKYKYIRNVNSFSDLIAIGIGAGGRIENYEFFHLNKLISFYAYDNELKMRVKKLSGILQYKTVKLDEIKELSGNSYENILNLLKRFEKEGLIKLNDKMMEYTLDGVFWGNSITACITEQMINDNK